MTSILKCFRSRRWERRAGLLALCLLAAGECGWWLPGAARLPAPDERRLAAPTAPAESVSLAPQHFAGIHPLGL